MKQIIKSIDWDGNEYLVPIGQLEWRPAAYGIIFKGSKILLSKQRHTYNLPGGGVELGEMPEQAAIREIKEETGVYASNPRFAGMITGFFTWNDKQNKKIHHCQSLLFYYVCDFDGGELSIDDFEEEENEYGEMPEWIDIDKLDDIVSGGTMDWIGLVKKSMNL